MQKKIIELHNLIKAYISVKHFEKIIVKKYKMEKYYLIDRKETIGCALLGVFFPLGRVPKIMTIFKFNYFI